MLNKTTIQGRLVADPEIRTTQGGTSVCSFRVAWSEAYKERERRLFIACSAWGGLGEMIEKHFAKGKEIIVEGALETREYESKDGARRSVIELRVDRAHFCGAKGADTAPVQNAPHAPAGGFTEVSENGIVLPF